MVKGGNTRQRTMNVQERWTEIAHWQDEIDNELHYNPTSAFWQRANALLQLLKFRTLALEGTEHVHTHVRQDCRT